MVKWEYRCETADEYITAQTNTLGREGWELATSYFDPCGKSVTLIFKRPIEEIEKKLSRRDAYWREKLNLND